MDRQVWQLAVKFSATGFLGLSISLGTPCAPKKFSALFSLTALQRECMAQSVAPKLTRSRLTPAESASILSLAKYKSNSSLKKIGRKSLTSIFTQQSLQARERNHRHETSWTCSPPGIKSHPTGNLQTRSFALPKKRKLRELVALPPSRQSSQSDTSSSGMEATRKGG